jgi:glycosyltransferase involved in cell wall biosynthesis
MIHLSIISPVYRGEGTVAKLVEQIEVNIKGITNEYEIILVEDFSPDDSWKEIEKICNSNTKVKGIQLSRNFGQHYAITCGLDLAKGNWMVVMDCDLQDNPKEIPNLYYKAQEGFDVVLAQRLLRNDGFLKKLSSKFFYKTLNYLTGEKYDTSIANFGIYHHKVIDTIKTMREPIRFFPTMVSWVGYKQFKLPVEHLESERGESSYNYKRLLNLALDIILSYSDKPIRLVIKFGALISSLSIIFLFITILRYLFGHRWEEGYLSIFISIWFFSGIIISILGIIGLYIGKIFDGVKQRPIYIINKKLN